MLNAFASLKCSKNASIMYKSLLFSKFFTFLRALFFRPFRLSLAPTICPWVSEDAGIPNHKNRSFRDTKRENTFYVSLGLFSSFPDVMTIFFEKPMCAFLILNNSALLIKLQRLRKLQYLDESTDDNLTRHHLQFLMYCFLPK